MVTINEMFRPKDGAKGGIFEQIDTKIAKLREGGMHVIDFGVGDPAKTMGAPDHVMEATIKGVPDHRFGGYPGNSGHKAFRTAASNYLKKKFGLNLDPDTEINITHGSKTAVYILPRLFVQPGDVVICPAPGYPGFKSGTEVANAEPYFLPLLQENDFLMDFKSVPADIAKRAKMMWINYPNSPTGKLAPRQWLEELVAWCKEHDIVLVSDEAYTDIYFGDTPPETPLSISTDGVVGIYSLSKGANMTGYRIGFMAGDKDIIAAFYKMKNMHDSGVPAFIQDAAVAALNSSDQIAELRDTYRQKKEILLEAFQSIGCPYPTWAESSIFLWVPSPKGVSGDDFASALLDAGIATIPGSAFMGQGQGSDYIRVSMMPNMDDINLAADRIRALDLKEKVRA